MESNLTETTSLIVYGKLYSKLGDFNKTVSAFKPPIFWKDKDILQKQVEIWSTKKLYDLLDGINNLELNLKKNSNLSNNMVFDFILNTSSN